jgi:hypothetical protein
LTRLAYGMLTEKRAYNTESHELPQVLMEELVRRKLLIPRGKVMEFRHDKVRAYLAFLYFKPRWHVLLADPKALVDSNWDAMIEFHLAQEQDADAAKGVFFLLLERDLETAKRCFSWLRSNRLDLCVKWQQQFTLAVADKILGDAPTAAD